jgi:hypothetical protein
MFRGPSEEPQFLELENSDSLIIHLWWINSSILNMNTIGPTIQVLASQTSLYIYIIHPWQHSKNYFFVIMQKTCKSLKISRLISLWLCHISYIHEEVIQTSKRNDWIIWIILTLWKGKQARDQQDPTVYFHSDLDHQALDGPMQPTATDVPCT